MKRFFPESRFRRAALGVTVALVAAASLVAGRERPASELVQSRPALAAPAVTELDLARLERREIGSPQADPFAPRSFAPPPAARQARVAAAPEPSAPPLPFVYVGKVTQAGATETFVLRGEELIAIAAGRAIDADYRVDEVGDSAIRFTYLPLGTQQSLEVAEAGG